MIAGGGRSRRSWQRRSLSLQRRQSGPLGGTGGLVGHLLRRLLDWAGRLAQRLGRRPLLGRLILDGCVGGQAPEARMPPMAEALEL